MKSKEERESDEMIKFEIQDGNPFSEGSSYASYKAKTKKKTVKKGSGISKKKL